MGEKVVNINAGKRRNSQRLAGARFIAAVHPAGRDLEPNDEGSTAVAAAGWPDFLQRYQTTHPDRFPYQTQLNELNGAAEQYLTAGQAVPARIMSYALELVEAASAEEMLFKHDVIIWQLQRMIAGELPSEFSDCLIGELVGVYDMPEDRLKLLWQDRYEHYLPNEPNPFSIDQS